MEAMETHLSGCMVPACCPEPSFRKACTMNNERTMNQSIHGEQRSNDEQVNPRWTTIERWTNQSMVSNDRMMNKSIHGEQRSNDEQVNARWTTIERWTSQSTVNNDRTMNQSIHSEQRSNDEQVNPRWATIEQWTSQSTENLASKTTYATYKRQCKV